MPEQSAWAQQRANMLQRVDKHKDIIFNTALFPKEVEDPGVGDEVQKYSWGTAKSILRGLAKPWYQLGGAVFATVPTALGTVFDSDGLREFGESSRQFVAASERWLDEALYDEPQQREKTTHVSRFAETSANVASNFSQIFLPAVGYASYLRKATVGLQGAELAVASAQAADKVRRVATASGGAIGFLLEGSGTFEEGIRKGEDPVDALWAGLAQGTASALLNAGALNRILKNTPISLQGKVKLKLNGAMDKLARRGSNAIIEASTEVAEEFTDLAAQQGFYEDPKELQEAIAGGMQVFGPTAFMTFIMFGPGVQSDTGDTTLNVEEASDNPVRRKVIALQKGAAEDALGNPVDPNAVVIQTHEGSTIPLTEVRVADDGMGHYVREDGTNAELDFMMDVAAIRAMRDDGREVSLFTDEEATQLFGVDESAELNDAEALLKPEEEQRPAPSPAPNPEHHVASRFNPGDNTGAKATPAALAEANKYGVNLTHVTGTGKNERITKGDVAKAAERQAEQVLNALADEGDAQIEREVENVVPDAMLRKALDKAGLLKGNPSRGTMVALLRSHRKRVLEAKAERTKARGAAPEAEAVAPEAPSAPSEPVAEPLGEGEFGESALATGDVAPTPEEFAEAGVPVDVRELTQGERSSVAPAAEPTPETIAEKIFEESERELPEPPSELVETADKARRVANNLGFEPRVLADVMIRAALGRAALTEATLPVEYEAEMQQFLEAGIIEVNENGQFVPNRTNIAETLLNASDQTQGEPSATPSATPVVAPSDIVRTKKGAVNRNWAAEQLMREKGMNRREARALLAKMKDAEIEASFTKPRGDEGNLLFSQIGEPEPDPEHFVARMQVSALMKAHGVEYPGIEEVAVDDKGRVIILQGGKQVGEALFPMQLMKRALRYQAEGGLQLNAAIDMTISVWANEHLPDQMDGPPKLLSERRWELPQRSEEENAAWGAQVAAFVAGVNERKKAGPPVRVATTAAEIEGGLPVGDRAAGFYNPQTGETWIIAGVHRTLDDVAETLTHEIIGHEGLERVLGKENVDSFYAKLSVARAREVEAYAKANNIELDVEGRILAAKEWLAERVGRGELNKISSVWARVKDFLRSGLARLTGKETWTDRQLQRLIVAAGRHTMWHIGDTVSIENPLAPYKDANGKLDRKLIAQQTTFEEGVAFKDAFAAIRGLSEEELSLKLMEQYAPRMAALDTLFKQRENAEERGSEWEVREIDREIERRAHVVLTPAAIGGNVEGPAGVTQHKVELRPQPKAAKVKNPRDLKGWRKEAIEFAYATGVPSLIAEVDAARGNEFAHTLAHKILRGDMTPSEAAAHLLEQAGVVELRESPQDAEILLMVPTAGKNDASTVRRLTAMHTEAAKTIAAAYTAYTHSLPADAVGPFDAKGIDSLSEVAFTDMYEKALGSHNMPVRAVLESLTEAASDIATPEQIDAVSRVLFGRALAWSTQGKGRKWQDWYRTHFASARPSNATKGSTRCRRRAPRRHGRASRVRHRAVDLMRPFAFSATPRASPLHLSVCSRTPRSRA